MNLSDWIDRHAELTPTKMAIRCGERQVTYGEMAQNVSRLAGALKTRLDIVRGDRVALLAQNAAQSLVLAFA
ncbi:MAG: AMP-binding protein, partial [Rhodospirillales bacterium]|nr:AMP-binding protein [Rhodospirillales bacterium]